MPRKGYKQTEEHRSRISASLKKYQRTPEHQEKIAEGHIKPLEKLCKAQLRKIARIEFKIYYPEPPWICFFCEGEIWEDFGWGSVNLNVHHDDGDLLNIHKNNLKGSHHGCHQRFHTLGNTYRRDSIARSS
jgi:tRNA U34 2-thiouridine synthase MnmA/TrmU